MHSQMHFQKGSLAVILTRSAVDDHTIQADNASFYRWMT